MNSDIPNPAQDSSSSKPTVASLRSEAVLVLGKRIVEELGPDQEVDTLARWMAHYIAELIQAAEAATGADRSAKMSECAASILDLWKHRSHLPHGRRPFEDLEPILNALRSLDPDSQRVRYDYQRLHEGNEGEEEPEVRQWLRIAGHFDDSARILIRYCLVRASQSALDKSKPWISLAEAVGLKDGVELPVLRLVKSESDLLEVLGNADRKGIEDRIRRLENFREASDILLSDLQERHDIEGRSGTKVDIEAAPASVRKARTALQETIKKAARKRNVLVKSEKSIDLAVDSRRKVTSRTPSKRTKAKAKQTKKRS